MKKSNYSSKKKAGIVLLLFLFIITPTISMANQDTATKSATTLKVAESSAATGVMGGSGVASGLSTIKITGIVAGTILVVGGIAAAASSSGSSDSNPGTTTSHH